MGKKTTQRNLLHETAGREAPVSANTGQGANATTVPGPEQPEPAASMIPFEPEQSRATVPVIVQAQLPHAPKDKEGLKSILDHPLLLEQVRNVAAQGVNARQILNLLLIAATRQPLIYECTTPSIMLCILRSAETGLPIGDVRGLAYVVPFRNKKGEHELQFMPGYRGLKELVLETGKVVALQVHLVREEDVFELHLGTDPKVIHRPSLAPASQITGAYAVAWFTAGGPPVIEHMRLDQLQAVRERSKAKDSGPWVTDWPEMARKTVLRRITKYLPSTGKLERAIAYDNEAVGYQDIPEPLVHPDADPDAHEVGTRDERAEEAPENLVFKSDAYASLVAEYREKRPNGDRAKFLAWASEVTGEDMKLDSSWNMTAVQNLRKKLANERGK